MRFHYDAQGRYTGRSQGCGLSCLQVVVGGTLASLAVTVPFIWPLLAFHGQAAWIAQSLWGVFLIVCFLLLGRRAYHVAQRRERAALAGAGTAPAGGQGPRDWVPAADDLGRPQPRAF
jgi:hypothetical protein